MLSNHAAELLKALQRSLGETWTCSRTGTHFEFAHINRGAAYQPGRRAPTWSDLLTTCRDVFAEHGITRGRLLPIRGNGETDFTISAVQALDPYLKRRQPFTHSSGYLPQPVVRFTGGRDNTGELRPGFLTAFVNISCVQPISEISEHAHLVDIWLSVLSRLGLHARHIRITGNFDTWQRGEIRGITLHVWHDELEIGDAVLLWNTTDPSIMATDIGSGLERLRWALARGAWHEVVFGSAAARYNSHSLNAVRAATLIAGAGIKSSARGPGYALQRILRSHPELTHTFGLSRVIKEAHQYWSTIDPLPIPWPEVCRLLEGIVFDES